MYVRIRRIHYDSSLLNNFLKSDVSEKCPISRKIVTVLNRNFQKSILAVDYKVFFTLVAIGQN